MLYKMQVGIEIDDDGAALIKRLAELGFGVEVIHYLDGDGISTVLADIVTQLDDDALLAYAETIVAPFASNAWVTDVVPLDGLQPLAPGVVEHTYPVIRTSFDVN